MNTFSNAHTRRLFVNHFQSIQQRIRLNNGKNYTILPNRKKFVDFWDEFEYALRDGGLVSTIPTSIKEVLTATGYNSAISILNIDENRIKQIEEFVEDKCRPLIDSFNEYSNTKPFKFLPGHRECIFGIKSELLKMQNNKKSKGTDRQDKLADEDDLRMTLETQLEAFTNNNGFSDINWTDAINSFKVTKNRANCSIKCPDCDSSINVTYITYWKLSNYFRHLRNHIKEKASEKATDKEVENMHGEASGEVYFVVSSKRRKTVLDGEEEDSEYEYNLVTE